MSYSLNAASPGQDAPADAERFGDLGFEPRQAVGQHRVEALFLGAGSVAAIVSPFVTELGIRVAHFAIQHADEPVTGTAQSMPRCLP